LLKKILSPLFQTRDFLTLWTEQSGHERPGKKQSNRIKYCHFYLDLLEDINDTATLESIIHLIHTRTMKQNFPNLDPILDIKAITIYCKLKKKDILARKERPPLEQLDKEVKTIYGFYTLYKKKNELLDLLRSTYKYYTNKDLSADVTDQEVLDFAKKEESK